MRVPTLRNIALTAPYMHDGRFATLTQVLEHYSDLGQRAQSRGGGLPDRRLPRRALTASERTELGAFLESLTDESFVRRYTADADAHRVAERRPAK
jgi:cytochrome c peroxidase